MISLDTWYANHRGYYVDKESVNHTWKPHSDNNEDPFPGECVSAVVSMLHDVYGAPFRQTFGNAISWFGGSPYPQTSKPEKGDIVVFRTGKYGHIGIYWGDGKIVDQNYFGKLAVNNISSFVHEPIYLSTAKLRKPGGIEVMKARNLLIINGRVTLTANRAIYPNIPTKKTPYEKVLERGSYFFNGYYLYKDYKGIDAFDRKCHFVGLYDVNGMKFIGYAPIYSNDIIEENVRNGVLYKKL